MSKDTIQMCVQNGIGHLVLDMSALVIVDDVRLIGSEQVSVRVRDQVIGGEDLLGEQIVVSTGVDAPPGGTVYGGNLQMASAGDAFLLFLKGSETSFSIAYVSNTQSTLLGCFLIRSMGNLPAFLDAVLFLDQYLWSAESIPDDFPDRPSLPACTGCVFLLHRAGQGNGGAAYRCGRILTPASLKGWLAEATLEAYGREDGTAPPPCRVVLPNELSAISSQPRASG
jgi:hypothetical protein